MKLKRIEQNISGDYIELIKLLKACGIAEHGADAKNMVREGEVKLNGEVELQLRKKIKRGDVVVIFDFEIHIL